MLLDKLKNFNIILGSQSPRRQFLLKELGINFTLKANNNIHEAYPDDINHEEIPVYLAKMKSDLIRDKIETKDILITADTIVYYKNQVINKPVDYNDAIHILKKLSGNMHEVITGVCITTLLNQVCFKSKTKVYFKELNEDEIRYYVKTYNPYDKAGAYGIQEWIGYIAIEKIEGSFFNVMGLPIEKLYTELDKFITDNGK